jgi:hypothetical protein
MKLKNTVAVKTALILCVVDWFCGLPSAIHQTAINGTGFAIAFWGLYLFFAGATLWGMIQLSSLRKQAEAFAERLKPRC